MDLAVGLVRAHSPPTANLTMAMQSPSLGLGTLTPQCLGVVGHIPLWTAVLVVTVRYASGPVWHRRPPWLRRFANENDSLGLRDEETGEDRLSRKRIRPWTAWGLALLLLSLAAVASGVVATVLFPPLIQQLAIPILPGIISALVLVVERPRTLPGAVFVIHTVLLLVQLVVSVAMLDLLTDWREMAALGVTILPPLGSVVVMLNMPMRDPLLDSTGIGKPFEEPTSAVRSPEDLITLWQWMTVSWMAPLIKIGYKRQLHDGDVWFLAYEFHHDRIHRCFREVRGTVLARLLKANGLDLLITTGLSVVETVAELAEPLLLRQLLAALAAETTDSKTALIYAAIMLFARLARAQTAVFNLWYQRRNYERSRGEMITMVYEKTLRRKAFTFPSGDQAPQTETPSPAETPTPTTLADSESEGTSGSSQGSLQKSKLSWLKERLQEVGKKRTKPEPAEAPASTGKILNLLRGDVYEVAQRFWEFPSIVTKPLNFFLSIALLWRILGPASLSGIFILVIGMSINTFFMRWMIRIETVRRAITDTKLQRTSQFVESIRHLRWYDWQGAWLAHIMTARRDELSKRITSNVISKAIGTVNALSAYLFPVAGFLAYTLLSGRPLTVDVAFPALNLFAMLQTSLRELPDLITVLLNAQVAMRRIEAFMLEPDKEDADDSPSPPTPTTPLEITLRNATFSFPGTQRKVLRSVTLTLRPGLTLVTGRVGAGKSALLQAILGELDQHSGTASVPHEMVGYCAQTPWLESMSIRDNILFCAPFDRARFDAVLDACRLREDLDRTFSGARDRTMIGENGVGLSGGQRARVALARAVYSRARVLVLDDPVAALDHHTATGILGSLFGEGGSGRWLMEGRLVILVTHRVDIAARYADQVVEVSKGGRVEVLDKEELAVGDGDGLGADGNAWVGEPDAIVTGDGQEEEEPAAGFMDEEHRVHGGVLASVYWRYVKAGKLGWWATVIVLFVLLRAAAIGYYWFLKEWGEGYTRSAVPYGVARGGMAGDDSSRQMFLGAASRQTDGDSWIDLGRYLPSPSVDVRPWLWWFLAISLAQVLAQTLADGALIVIIYHAGKNLFEEAMQRVSNATFRFYDVTPVGRLMNRLTSDMGTVDGQIANQVMSVALYSISWLSSMAVIATATPLFLVLSVAMTALFVLIFDRFLPTSQSLRRLETVSLSPLMSNFGALVEGLTTVRAFRAAPHFQQRIIKTTDAFQKMDHIYWSLQAWLQIRFDALSALTTFALTVTAITSGLSSGAVGFVLAAASNFVQSTHSLCRRYGEMQMQFVSVERVVELLSLEQEPRGSVLPPAAWPAYGDDVVLDRVTLRYAPGLDPVLHDVSLRIPGGANVAVTGRTGSGKSTLALSLLGTLHPDAGGRITIGGVDLATVDKHALRRNITFVAQDPVLFPGTLRDNLDPLDERDETERAVVLARVLGAEFTLDSRVDAGGKNLSQGQRQLVGLGRAMLRRSPVVVLDEATASIDGVTAGEIQRLLREELGGSTVITIAHKKEAVEGADWEVVMDGGRVVRAGPLGGAAVGEEGVLLTLSSPTETVGNGGGD
ncbi:putative ATP-dependent permease [Podospora conica]|nr:putative ATP-dependent permease [Schizothecium conicum]